MRRTVHSLLITALCFLPAPVSAQLTVLTSGGFAAPFEQIRPEFEKTAAVTVTTLHGASQGTGPDTIGAQLGRGVDVDLVIMAKEGLADLIKDGRILAGTETDLACTPLGIAVRAGAPKPDISSVEAFKRAVLAAKAVSFPGSTTGIWLKNELFPRLGIAAQLAGKVLEGNAAVLASGRSELAIQPVSELVHAAGVDYAGTLPADIQYISVFSTGIVKSSPHAEAARRLLDYLKSDKAKPALRAGGMEALR